MSRDPLGYSEGPNLYAYVGNNPSTFTDPWGTEKVLLASNSVDFILNNTRRLDTNDSASWTRVNSHIDNICMRPENAAHYYCIDAVHGAINEEWIITEKDLDNYDKASIVADIWSLWWTAIAKKAIILPILRAGLRSNVDTIGRMIVRNYDQIFKQSADHIFASKHGFWNLTTSQKKELFKQFSNQIESRMDKVVQWSYEIRTIINWKNTTIRFFVQNGKMTSINAFQWFSERIIWTLLK